MRKLLIADNSILFAQLLALSLEDRFQIRTCCDGDTALQLLEEFRPDALVIHLSLPGKDGFSVLQCASRRPPVILGITNFLNPYVEQTATRLGIGYLLRSPSLHTVAMRLTDLMEQPVHDRESVIRQHLQALSFSPKNAGYHYLLIGLEEYCRERCTCSALYRRIAEKADTADWRNVERAIRTALEGAWRRRDAALWRRYFLHSSQCPSTKEFLDTLVPFLQQNGL